MPWIVNFEDGSTIGSKHKYWTDLPKDKKITGLQLVYPDSQKQVFLALMDFDKYYFTYDAIAPFGQKLSIIAETIGGQDLALGICVEVRLEYTGGAKITAFPLERFIYDNSILYEGVGKKNTKVGSVK